MEIRNHILKFPEQLLKGAEIAKTVKIDKTYEKVLLCGMGGSGMPGEILAMWQEFMGIPLNFYVHRDYDLPPWVSENDLVICVSWSGDTKETISSFKAAQEKGLKTVAVTGGGQLKKLAWVNKAELILLPDDKIPPRFGVGYMAGAVFGLLGAENQLNFKIKAEDTEEEGKELALKIGHAIPLIYSSFKWRKLANFWKILFNENAKIPSFWNFFPLLAHNEIAGFSESFRNIIHPILIKDADDDKRQNSNIDTAIAFFKKLGYNYSIVKLSGDSALEKVLNSYILGLWTSCYLAENLGIKPEDTSLIEEFKKAKRITPHIKLIK